VSESSHILLVTGGEPVPDAVRSVLGERGSLREPTPGARPEPDDLETADLVVLTGTAVRADPPLTSWLRGLTVAPLLLLREDADRIPPALSEFDDAALMSDEDDLDRRSELLLDFRESWTRALELGVTGEDIGEELELYGLDRNLVGPRGFAPPGRVSLHHLVEVEMVTRQQLAICRLMGTAHGTFYHAAEPRGLPERGGEEAASMGALSPYCAYLSAQGRICLNSEFGAAQEALLGHRPVERNCSGGIPLYSVPVCLTFKGLTYPLYAATVAVGGVPGAEKIARIAREYGVNPEILLQMAVESNHWILNTDKAEEIKATIANLAETISRETSHKYATAYKIFRGLMKEWEIRRSERLLSESHRKLEKTNRQLTAKNEEIYELTQAITHDLKKPLSSMKATLSLLRGGRLGELAETQMLAVETGHEAAQYMQQLVEDLLESARLDAGRKLFEFERTPLLPILERIRRRLQFQLEEEDITLEFGDLPEAVSADPSAIEKVFMNLIGNAVNYIGEGRKVITVHGEEAEELVRVTVEDSGIGIPEEFRESIFEKFRRGGNVRGIQGTGLGLSIVLGIVKAHGGEVTLESEEGVGTRISLTLPRVVEEGDETLEVAAASSPGEVSP
jgi:signal transduction histidine kinase